MTAANRLSLVGLFCLACGPTGDSKASARPSLNGDSTALVIIDQPAAVAFFRPAKDSVEEEGDAYNEGVAHVRFAIEDAAACLGKDSARILMVIDTAVRIQRGATVDTIYFSRVDSLSYGMYLIAPDKEPRLISGFWPSALNHAVAEAIPEYFHRPPCPPR